MSTPTPPEGYRLLEPGEPSKPTGIHRRVESSDWVQRNGSESDTGQFPSHVYARRIEPEPLQPGKHYRQRDGGKAFIVARLPRGGKWGEDYIGLNSHENPEAWFSDGKLNDDAGESEYDIIGPWIDEPTDQEIAEAVRWIAENNMRVSGAFDGPLRCEPGYRSISPREFVDAVNQYRNA